MAWTVDKPTMMPVAMVMTIMVKKMRRKNLASALTFPDIVIPLFATQPRPCVQA
jgi:hypothetical protein